MKCLFYLQVISVLLLCPTTVIAGDLELGLDGGFEYSFKTEFQHRNGLIIDTYKVESRSVFSVPFQHFRLGWFINPTWEFEPRLSIKSISTGDAKDVQIGMDLGVLANLAKRGVVPYLEGGVGYRYVENEESRVLTSGSAPLRVSTGERSQFGFFGGVGMRIPTSETVSIRLALSVSHWAESKSNVAFNSIELLPVRTLVALSAGLSMFP